MELLNTFSFLAITLISLLFIWMMKQYSYWRRIGVQCPYPHNYIFGHTKRLLLQQDSFGVTYAKIYNSLKKKGLGFGGFYFCLKPVFMPIDLKIVKRVVQNDANNFMDRGLYANETGDPISTNLFNLEGYKWRHLRAKLTPTFTSGKMKMMFKILIDSANGLQKIMENEEGNRVDIKDILAGFETSSSVMTFCLFELCLNKEIQDRVRKEIREVIAKYNGELSYEALMEMKYMDKVIKETMRKYPSLPFLDRMCSNNYELPGTDVTLEKGTKISISLIGLHYDPDYFPDPEKFDPERFAEGNSIPDYAYLPFGSGPRNCIGQRFGIMQMKVGIACLLRNFEFKLSEKTVLPFEYDTASLVTTLKGDIWLEPKRLTSK